MSIARNTLYNIAGSACSVVVALVTIPPYLHQIGEARYGVLALIWLLLGYFGLFDLGLSRATANYIARLRGDAAADREAVFWTAMLLNAGLGLLGAIVLYFVGGPVLGHWLKMTPGIHAEAIATLPWIAIGVPVATCTAVMTGALTGRERFGVVNVVQVGGMILFLVVPLIVAYVVGPQLNIVVPAAVLSRCAVIAPLLFMVKKFLPLSRRPHFHREKMRELLGYGAWISVTNVVGPVLSTFDRFFIGAMLGAPSVALYDVPFKLVERVRVMPSALSTALFPRLSAVCRQDRLALTVRTISILDAVMTPVIVLGLFAIQPLMNVWVGPAFTLKSAPVGELLLVGAWLNVFALVPFAALQAAGRPDLTGKVHLAQLIPYVVCLWAAIHVFGLIGAAAVWAVRVAADTVIFVSLFGVAVATVKLVWPSLVVVVGALGIVYILPSWDLMKVGMCVVLFALACIRSHFEAPGIAAGILGQMRVVRPG